MAPSILEWSGRHVMVLRRLRGRIYGERAGRPHSMTLRAGTLDDTTWLVPIAHMYVRRRAAMGLARARRRMPRDRPRRFQAVGPSVARDVA